jgi:hypothetical protein
LPSRVAKRDGRKLLAVLLAFAALGGVATSLSGCGASATLDPVALAARVSSEQTGMRMSYSMSFAAGGLSSGEITGHGYFNQRERSGVLSMDLSGLSSVGVGAAGAGLEHMQLIFKYPLMYMNFPVLSEKVGKPWVQINLQQLAQERGIQLSQLSSVNQTNPAEFLNYLRASGGAVTKVGQETVNGVPTTHYDASISVARIIESYPSSTRSTLQSSLRALSTNGSIPVEVWIDNANRVRRMKMSVNVSVPAGGGEASPGATPAGASATMTMDFTSYGAVPPVPVPGPSEVFDASALLHAGLSGGNGE